MYNNFNKVIIIGNLGHDPEIRYTQSGMAVTTLNVAISETKQDQKKYTDWFNIVCLGKLAENTGKYLKKGRQVFVDGKLQNRVWENKEGNKSIITEIIAKQVIFLGNKDADRNSKDVTENKKGKEDIPF